MLSGETAAGMYPIEALKTMVRIAVRTEKEIRSFFNQLRQEFLDWHGTVFGTPEFEAQKQKVSDFYLAKAVN